MLEDKTKMDIIYYSKRKSSNITNKINLNKEDKYLSNNNKNKNYKYFNNILIKKILLRKMPILLLYYDTIVTLFFSISQIGSIKRKFFLYDSSIHLKVNSGDYILILSSYFYNKFLPNEIRTNGNIRTDKQNSYSLSESENNVTISWNIKITSTFQMFEGCLDIIEIDFSDFDSSEITQMNNMFTTCSSLRTINFTNFNTSKVTIMNNMFVLCSALISLDLSNFDTSKVESMSSMFNGCRELTSLNLSNFNTSQVTSMSSMFSGCSSLSSLDLSNFDASKVTLMENIFSVCSLLSYLFLSNFDLSKTSWDYILNGLLSLQFVNLKGSNIYSSFVNRISKINPQNLTICSDRYDYFGIYFSNAQKMICDKMSNDERKEKEFICYFNHSLEYNKYSCDICGENNFYQIYNEEDINNTFNVLF